MSRPDEVLLWLWDRYSADQRAWERREAIHSTNEELYRFLDQQDDLILAMLDTPATTTAGVLAKLKVALTKPDEEPGFREHLLFGEPEPGRMDVTRQDNLIWSAIRDLERLADAARLGVAP